MKYSIGEFEINKAYAEKLAHRRQMFIEQVRPKKAVHLVMVTASGLKQNAHSHIVQSSVSLDGLWSKRR